MAPAADTLPQTIVGISFNDAFRAQEFMTATSGLAAKKSLVLHDAVVVRKDNDGKTNVVETIDPSVGRSATSGALWASFLGLLIGGPVGWIAGGVIGAGAGAITAKVVDLGVPDEWVDWFKNAVDPNTTTVVLLLTDVTINDFVAETERFVGAKLLYANLDQHSFDRITSALAGKDMVAGQPADSGSADSTEIPLASPPTEEPAI